MDSNSFPLLKLQPGHWYGWQEIGNNAIDAPLPLQLLPEKFTLSQLQRSLTSPSLCRVPYLHIS